MKRTSLVLRTPSGVSGDMLLTGLSKLNNLSNAELSDLVDSLGLPALHGVITIEPHHVNAISGWQARIDLPHEHHHRTLNSIREIINASGLTDKAKQLALDTFICLGKAEAKVHGIELEKVAFHEVGALDSILDICVASALFCRLAPAHFYCSPIPLCDGIIQCEHGLLPAPAPAVQEMLVNVPVYGIDARGETITPTALAFLKAANARFGKWPAVEIIDVARAYGGKVFDNVPNGALFFLVNETP